MIFLPACYSMAAERLIEPAFRKVLEAKEQAENPEEDAPSDEPSEEESSPEES